MEKREYVTRLKKMLTNKNDACEYCPCAYHYNKREKVEISDCRICQAFAGLKFKDPKYNDKKCPCHRPGRLGAVARAWQKIEAYEAMYGEV